MSSSFWTLTVKLNDGRQLALIDQEAQPITFVDLKQVERTAHSLRRLGQEASCYIANEFYPTRDPGKWSYSRTVIL